MIIVGPMTNKLTASLREAPATVPALVAVALFVVWATSQAGYPVTHWAPGGLIVLALLGIAFVFIGVPWGEMPLSVRVALGCLLAFTLFSYLSILWAGVPGDAWEGANRTLLYLLVFALFACWPQRGLSAALLLGLWTTAMALLAAFTLAHIDASGSAGLRSMLPGGRLAYPSGYPNASAAQWLMAFWPALLLARSKHLPWVLRGLLAGGAVLLAEVALLSQSRGSLYATPVMLVLVFALLPGRVRTFALLIPVGAGIGVAAPSVLAVGDHLRHEAVTHANVDHAMLATFAAAAVVALVVALAALVESRASLSQPRRDRVRRGVGAVAIALLLVAILAGVVIAGNPIARVESGWKSFKGGYGGSQTGSRLVGGLGSNRYDFYRVALDEFVAHPLIGIGADNFQEPYLAHGHSEETPHYPHSVELRTLVQTGLLGTLFAVIGLGAALLAGMLALRRADPLGRAVAAGALGCFGYWVVHGSFDWFWEFAGLGAAAFAMLGLCCSLGWPPAADRPAPSSSRTRVSRRPRGRMALVMLGGLVVALAAAASLSAPWLSQLEIQSAAHVFRTSPRIAYSRLEGAASLDPLSDEADVVAGDIALRYGDLPRADREFRAALARTPGNAFATLERGAIASAKGERSRAIALLSRAVRLDPHESLARQALAIVREGQSVSIEGLNRSILLKSEQFG
jgi:hypothetical protein